MKFKKINKKLSLKNNGELEIVFLGTGTQFSKTLFNNNIIIIKGDVHILVDFGFNALKAIEEIGLEPMDFEVFLSTHSHSDHIGGMENLLLLNRYVATIAFNKPKIKLLTVKEYSKILWNHSLKGGLEWNEASETGKMKLEDYCDLIFAEKASTHNRTKFKLNFEGIELEFFGTNHIPDTAKTQKKAFISFGLFIDNRVFYSSDTKFDRALLDIYADKSEVIFHDCSFKPNPVHSCIDDLKTLPEKWREKMFLMHYSDDWEMYDVSDFAGLAKEKTRYIF